MTSQPNRGWQHDYLCIQGKILQGCFIWKSFLQSYYAIIGKLTTQNRWNKKVKKKKYIHNNVWLREINSYVHLNEKKSLFNFYNVFFYGLLPIK
jgi:hypothetical protein